VEWLHPVSLEQEISVNIEVAAVIAADFNAELLLNLFLVQELADPAKSRVAKIAGIFTFAANIIDVLASLLVWSNHGIVAVDACRNTRPDALAVVAVLNHALAARQSVLHRLTLSGTKNSRIATLATSHRLV